MWYIFVLTARNRDSSCITQKIYFVRMHINQNQSQKIPWTQKVLGTNYLHCCFPRDSQSEDFLLCLPRRSMPISILTVLLLQINHLVLMVSSTHIFQIRSQRRPEQRQNPLHMSTSQPTANLKILCSGGYFTPDSVTSIFYTHIVFLSRALRSKAIFPRRAN